LHLNLHLGDGAPLTWKDLYGLSHRIITVNKIREITIRNKNLSLVIYDLSAIDSPISLLNEKVCQKKKYKRMHGEILFFKEMHPAISEKEYMS